MPNYYNPNIFYPATYQNPMMNGYQQPISYGGVPQPMPQQSYTASQKAMEWVEGEVGAKAFQMPSGWPANQPIPLWDSTDTVIYLKSWNQMGIPNPMQKLKYEMPQQQVMLPAGQSGDQGNVSGATQPDMSQYVTKDDLNQMRQEIRNMMNNNGSSYGNFNSGNQNGSNPQRNNQQNRGEQK